MERPVSHAGLILNQLRSAMIDETLHKILFLYGLVGESGSGGGKHSLVEEEHRWKGKVRRWECAGGRVAVGGCGRVGVGVWRWECGSESVGVWRWDWECGSGSGGEKKVYSEEEWLFSVRGQMLNSSLPY